MRSRIATSARRPRRRAHPRIQRLAQALRHGGSRVTHEPRTRRMARRIPIPPMTTCRPRPMLATAAHRAAAVGVPVTCPQAFPYRRAAAGGDGGRESTNVWSILRAQALYDQLIREHVALKPGWRATVRVASRRSVGGAGPVALARLNNREARSAAIGSSRHEKTTLTVDSVKMLAARCR